MLYFEALTCAKNAAAPETNEDQIVVVPNAVYAVIDGATDISGKRYDDRLGTNATGGRLAARAVAQALYGLPLTSPALPSVSQILTAANAAVADVYDRLGVSDAAAASGDNRFRAAMAAVFVDGEAARLFCLGDCSIRINGGEVVKHSFPGDTVFAVARANAWRILAARGVAPEIARPAVRQLIVAGLSAPAPAPLTDADRSAIRDAVHADARVRAEGIDSALIERALSGGLQGVRTDPSAFNASVVDGVSHLDEVALCRDMALADIGTLELFSDGYPMMGDAPNIAAWEAALALVDATDPERVGEFASTKGRVGAFFGDDRSILIVKTQRD